MVRLKLGEPDGMTMASAWTNEWLHSLSWREVRKLNSWATGSEKGWSKIQISRARRVRREWKRRKKFGSAYDPSHDEGLGS
ncbi:MAG: hypothetical protein KGL39_55295 [Patescibacteria group bacterium]|nr:hypothetical protein [Patescibacteria group bacterium]